MTKQEADLIGSMNMCDEISNEAYKKIMCNCEVEEEECEDCISRQAVLDKKELVELEDGQSFYCINPEDVETLQPVTPQQRWIPVSERLPEEGGAYLVTTKWKGSYSGDVYIETNMAVYRKQRKEWDCVDVIAWMLLPEPYKEK